jgi:hemoglobin
MPSVLNSYGIMMASPGKLDHVSEDNICQLVDAFYRKVRTHPDLGPVFARAIPGDWQPHLNKMYAFWSSVMLTSGRYKGNPVARHLAVEGIEPPLFEQWLALFDETCGELFDDRLRAQFGGKAARIAESLKLALFYRPDRPWPPQPAT